MITENSRLSCSPDRQVRQGITGVCKKETKDANLNVQTYVEKVYLSSVTKCVDLVNFHHWWLWIRDSDFPSFNNNISEFNK